jgi:taurine dioxygenase
MATPLVSSSKIEIRPYAPNLGAEIRGISLADGVTAEEFHEIRDAFLAHQVLFFRNQQEISPERHIAFGRMFGELHAHPAAPAMQGHPEIFEIHAHRESRVANGEFWHSDVSCDEIPPLGTMLQLHVLPSCGEYADGLNSDTRIGTRVPG